MAAHDGGLAGRILRLARELGAIRTGEFTLASGQRSTYYFDGRLLTLSAEGLNLTGQALLPWVRAAGAEAVGGLELAAVPVAASIAMVSGQDGGRSIAAFVVRKEVKRHGTGKRIEGPLRERARVAVVDDTCSTGGSIRSAIDAVEADGHQVVLVATLLDRCQGGGDDLIRRGYVFRSLLRVDSAGRFVSGEERQLEEFRAQATD